MPTPAGQLTPVGRARAGVSSLVMLRGLSKHLSLGSLDSHMDSARLTSGARVSGRTGAD